MGKQVILSKFDFVRKSDSRRETILIPNYQIVGVFLFIGAGKV